MRNWILRWLASILALILIVGAYSVLPVKSPREGIWVDSFSAVLIAVVALSLANCIIKPIILFFAWPINCITFGLFGFVLNVLLFLIVGHLSFGFHVTPWIHALIGSVAMGVLSGVINSVLQDSGEPRKRPKPEKRD